MAAEKALKFEEEEVEFLRGCKQENVGIEDSDKGRRVYTYFGAENAMSNSKGRGSFSYTQKDEKYVGCWEKLGFISSNIFEDSEAILPHGLGVLRYTNEQGKKRIYAGKFSWGKFDGRGVEFDEKMNPIRRGAWDMGDFKS
ncbi:hypothetical protein AGMMS49975_06440 [Clostridia bacterium]|nr:hypothetical protein AGMMS49975_06440 [Clostridia bacterium]